MSITETLTKGIDEVLDEREKEAFLSVLDSADEIDFDNLKVVFLVSKAFNFKLLKLLMNSKLSDVRFPPKVHLIFFKYALFKISFVILKIFFELTSLI